MPACIRKSLLVWSVSVLLVLLAGGAYHVAAQAPTPIGERIARTDEHLVALERRVASLESSMEWSQRTQLGALGGIVMLLIDALWRARQRREG